MKKAIAYFFQFKKIGLTLLFVYLTGCSTVRKSIFLELSLENYPEISMENVYTFSADSTLYIQGNNIHMPGKIRWINFDSSRRHLLENYDPWDTPSGRGLVTLCYRLQDEKIVWASQSNPYYGLIFPDYFELWFSDGKKLISRKTGMIFAEYPRHSVIMPKRRLWIQTQTDSTGKHLVAKSLTGGEIKWQAKLTGGGDWSLFDGDKKYSVGNGLYCLDYSNGNTWSLNASTSTTEGHLKAALLSVLSITAAAMGGGYATMKGPDHITGLSSAPFILNNSIYFIAKDYLYSVNKKDGTLIRKTHLKVPPSQAALCKADSNLLVIYNGWRYKNNALANAGKSAAFIVSRQDSLVLSSFETEIDQPIIDYFYTKNKIYLLSIDKVYILDQKLRLSSELSSESYGRFLKIFSPDSMTIYIRTTRGILSLAQVPFQIKWWRKLAEIRVDPSVNRRGVRSKYTFVDGKLIVRAGSWQDLLTTLLARKRFTDYYFYKDFVWIQTTKGMTCLRKGDGFSVMELTFSQNGSPLLIHNGLLRYFHEGKIILWSLNLKTKQVD